MSDSDYIAGLLREREMLEQAGDKERVRQVDAELQRVGYQPYETALMEPVAEKAVVHTRAQRRKPRR